MKRRKFIKRFSILLSLIMLYQTFYPTVALALTGGPSQPEMQAFEPIGTTEMVDLSTGAFTYNIPLMDVEGYPINLSYHSGITMDQEASWVGLGWNINAGEINRQMRGIPDDFKGDNVTQTFNMKDNETVGFSMGAGIKVVGFPISGSKTMGIFNNNYKGPGLTYSVNASISASNNAGQANKGTLTAGLGENFNTQTGIDITPTFGFSGEVANANNTSISLGLTVGAPYNSRAGLKGITMRKDLSCDKILPVSEDQTIDERDGFSSSSFLSFSAPTYVPTITMPLVNNTITLDANLGAEIYGIYPNMTYTGWFNQTTLATHSLSLPAYGYMYADQAKNDKNALHDFNREKDVPFLPHITNLPITNFTYDLYSINGQGISGQFRPFRGDVGILYDHEVTNETFSGSLGLEEGICSLLHAGVDINTTFSGTTTGQWQADNAFSGRVLFQNLQTNDINYEPFYFKRIGEHAVNDNQYYSSIGDVNPMRVNLNRHGSTVDAETTLDYNNHENAVSSNLVKTRREKRSQSVNMLNAQEANYFGLDKTINSYPLNHNVYSGCSSTYGIQHFSRLSWPFHHTSEITVTNPDGKRYVYGLPAYNTVHNEVTFAALEPAGFGYTNDSINSVQYSSTDNSINNTEGRDNYYNKQQIPPYAHSYLLTGVLSPDYVDLTGDGITDDDLGEAVKINYTNIYNKTNPYKWRTPIEKDSASFQPGLLSDKMDDKANYIYGEKEVWYAHSIESKTMVAQFILQNRFDGYGVKDENGGVDTTKHLQCIKEINLYSKADLIMHGSNAVPIKTVHFEYTYELCPGVPNSDCAGGKGKLTLKKVFFTYGNNTEGNLNRYQFNYSGFNPKYDHNRYDKWGYYKYNPTSSNMPSVSDFPYALQDSARMSKFCQAWDMTDIDLPSGGHIRVNYESNDYAYVQNKRAGQMFLVQGLGENTSSAPGNQLFAQHLSGFNWDDWVFVSLPTPVTNDQDFHDKYLDGIGKLYFKFLVDVDGLNHWEYVPGYADISNYKMIDHTHGAIQLSRVGSDNKLLNSVQPIALASWQFVRLNLPQYAYTGSEFTGGVMDVIDALACILTDAADMYTGFDFRVACEKFGRTIIPDHSWIRLDNPNYKKLGGGARVSEIDISDNWSSMVSGQSSFTYGQNFDYTTQTFVNSKTLTISSGVATYEPLLGGDENPCRQPMPYEEKYLLAPNNNFYTETPLGENLYPSPGIIYSKVTVTNLQYPGVSRTATGFTINEFYTAHDFPTLNQWTDMDVERVKPNILSTIFSLGVKDFSTVSQGFTVEVNDMPGKEKSKEIRDAHNSVISSEAFTYLTDPNNQNHLSNTVTVANPDGTFSAQPSVGKDIDVWEDMRQQETNTYSYGASVAVDFFLIDVPPVPIPVIIPSVFPSYSSENTRFAFIGDYKIYISFGVVKFCYQNHEWFECHNKKTLFMTVKQVRYWLHKLITNLTNQL